MAISVRLNDDDTLLVKEYAKLHNLTVSELFRTSVLEKIENELDLKAYEEAIKEYKSNPVTYKHDEVVKMLELD